MKFAYILISCYAIAGSAFAAENTNSDTVEPQNETTVSRYEIKDSDKRLSKLFQRWAKEAQKDLVWESSNDVIIQEHELWRKWSTIENAASLDDAYKKVLRIAPTMALRLDHRDDSNAINARTRPLYFSLCKYTVNKPEYLVRGNTIPCDRKSPINRLE